jgi:hypothetical protein
MFKIFDTIKYLKKIKNVDINISQNNVNLFKNELESFIKKNPVIKIEAKRQIEVEEGNFSPLFNKLNFKTMPLIIVLALVLGGGGTALASQNSLPGDFLYPVKIATEEIKEKVIFDAGAKANLQADLADKRVEEAKKLIEKNEINAEKLEIVYKKIIGNAEKISGIITAEKNQGKNIEKLAENASYKIAKSKNELDVIINQKVLSLKNQIQNSEEALSKPQIKVEELKNSLEEITEKNLELNKNLNEEIKNIILLYQEKNESLQTNQPTLIENNILPSQTQETTKNEELEKNGEITDEKIYVEQEVNLIKPVVEAGCGGTDSCAGEKNSTLKIINFEQCVAAGYPILKSNPAQCVANGVTFYEDYSENGALKESGDYNEKNAISQ